MIGVGRRFSSSMLRRLPKSLRWASHRSKQERQIVRLLLAFAGALLAVDILLLSALH